MHEGAAELICGPLFGPTSAHKPPAEEPDDGAKYQDDGDRDAGDGALRQPLWAACPVCARHQPGLPADGAKRGPDRALETGAAARTARLGAVEVRVWGAYPARARIPRVAVAAPVGHALGGRGCRAYPVRGYHPRALVVPAAILGRQVTLGVDVGVGHRVQVRRGGEHGHAARCEDKRVVRPELLCKCLAPLQLGGSPPAGALLTDPGLVGVDQDLGALRALPSVRAVPLEAQVRGAGHPHVCVAHCDRRACLVVAPVERAEPCVVEVYVVVHGEVGPGVRAGYCRGVGLPREPAVEDPAGLGVCEEDRHPGGRPRVRYLRSKGRPSRARRALLDDPHKPAEVRAAGLCLVEGHGGDVAEGRVYTAEA